MVLVVPVVDFRSPQFEERTYFWRLRPYSGERDGAVQMLRLDRQISSGAGSTG